MAVNYLYGRNIYPTLGGETAGDLATGPLGLVRSRAETAQAPAPAGPAPNVLTGLLVFAVLTAAIMWVAHRFGEAGEFSNIKASAYNVLLISLVAVAGIPVWKFLFTRFRVPGVSEWVLSV